jgi:hypothetical protein
MWQVGIKVKIVLLIKHSLFAQIRIIWEIIHYNVTLLFLFEDHV